MVGKKKKINKKEKGLLDDLVIQNRLFPDTEWEIEENPIEDTVTITGRFKCAFNIPFNLPSEKNDKEK